MILIYLVLTILMLCVIYTDARHYLIPNWLNLAVVAVYPLLMWLDMPEPWWSGFAAMGVMLLVGIGFFMLGIMGGGDVKLITALMLWTGWTKASVMFLLYFSLLGGVLALSVFLLRVIGAPLHTKLLPHIPLPRIMMRKQPIPYGIAIAIAFLMLLHTQQIPTLPHP